MATIHVETRDLPQTVRDVLKELKYGRRDIPVDVGATFSISNSGGSGQKAFWSIVNLATGRHHIEWGSWGGSNMFNTRNPVDLDTGLKPLPPGAVVIKGHIGDGPTYARIIAHPDNVPLLSAPKSESDALTPEEQKALNIIGGIKSGYRADEFRRARLGLYGATNPVIQSLAAKGMISVTGVGISITTKGKGSRVQHFASVDRTSNKSRDVKVGAESRNPFPYAAFGNTKQVEIGFKVPRLHEPLWWTGGGFKNLAMVAKQAEIFPSIADAEHKIKTELLDFIRKYRPDEVEFIKGWGKEDKDEKKLVEDAKKELQLTVKSIKSALHPIFRKMKVRDIMPFTSWDQGLTITGSYSPISLMEYDEGGIRRGEAYEDDVKDEIAQWRKVLDPVVKPFKKHIFTIKVEIERTEKSWVKTIIYMKQPHSATKIGQGSRVQHFASIDNVAARYVDKTAGLSVGQGTWKIQFDSKGLASSGPDFREVTGFLKLESAGIITSTKIDLFFVPDASGRGWSLDHVSVPGVTSGRVELIFESLASKVAPAVAASLT